MALAPPPLWLVFVAAAAIDGFNEGDVCDVVAVGVTERCFVVSLL